jgi:hypothetical protein
MDGESFTHGRDKKFLDLQDVTRTGIAMGYYWTARGSITNRDKSFSLLHSVWGPLNILSNGFWGP